MNRSNKKVEGTGWVGFWLDGTLGWNLPAYLCGYSNNEFPMDREYLKDDDELILCKITVTPVKDTLGRKIVRKAGTLRKLKGIK